jgi:hypothetical protein
VGKSQGPLEAHRLILSSASRVFEKLLYESEALMNFEDGKILLLEPEFTFIPFEVFLTVSVV